MEFTRPNIKKLLNSSGQSAVEYIILLALIAFLANSVFNSSYFKNFFGEDSDYFSRMRDYIQFSYRHGVSPNGKTNDATDLGSGVHETYFIGGGDTKFFTPTGKYPE